MAVLTYPRATGVLKDLLELTERADPTLAADTGQTYTNDVGGRTELMYMDDTGVEIQITSAGVLNGGAVGLTATYVGFGSGSGTLTGEAAFAYDSGTNVLTVDTIRVGTGTAAAPSYSWSAAGYDDDGIFHGGVGGILLVSLSGVAKVGWVVSDRMNLASDMALSWHSGVNVNSGSSDTYLLREAAATIQMGADANGAAIAQTFKAHDGITGTDIAGANLTLAGGRGTGAGAVGNLILSTSTLLGSGTTAQTLSARVTITGTTITATLPILEADGTVSAPSYSVASDTDTGAYLNAVGASSFAIAFGGTMQQGWAGGGSYFHNDLNILSTGVVGWSSGNPLTAGLDTKLARDAAANTLALKNSTNAQTFNHYGSEITAGSRYSRLAIKHATTSVTAAVGATVTATNLIPTKANVLGVNTVVTTALGTGTGTTGYTVGDGTDADRWGSVTGTAAGTDTDQTDATADPTGWFNAANNVVLTALGGNFDGTGVILVDVAYTMTEAA